MKPTHRIARLLLASSLVLSLAARAEAHPQLVANAGPDRFLLPPATSLKLHGSVRGVKHSEIPNDAFITWTRLTGPAATILDEHTLAPTVVPSGPGAILIRLKAFDPDVGADTDDVLVTMLDPGQTGVLGGQTRVWQKLTLTFTHGAVLSETGSRTRSSTCA
jgi:hypothetical protein